MKELLVQDTNSKMVYEVSTHRQGSDAYYHIHLDLVCGWDYVKPDESDIQGYVGAENFIDDVQLEILTFYPFDESVKGRLAEEGYEVVTREQLGIEHLLSAI